MRKLGHIADKAHARVFADYLYARGIVGELDFDADGGVDIWVHDEDALEDALRELTEFEEHPDDPEYAVVAADGAARRARERSESKLASRRVSGGVVAGSSFIDVAPVTFALIVISVVVTLFGGLGSGSSLTSWLSVSSYYRVGQMLHYNNSLSEILHGQVWRLITPVFIHASLFASGMGFLHLLFNMMWLKDLGGMLEGAQGSRSMLVKFLVLAMISNLAQFYFSGPMFGGMSGVVYGLLGYCWIRGRQDLTSGLFVQSQTAGFMVVWFFLCLFGVMGPVANAAHGAGLLVGLVLGWLDSRRVNS